jgi:hypothetical protein
MVHPNNAKRKQYTPSSSSLVHWVILRLPPGHNNHSYTRFCTDMVLAHLKTGASTKATLPVFQAPSPEVLADKQEPLVVHGQTFLPVWTTQGQLSEHQICSASSPQQQAPYLSSKPQKHWFPFY